MTVAKILGPTGHVGSSVSVCVFLHESWAQKLTRMHMCVKLTAWKNQESDTNIQHYKLSVF